MIGNFLYSGHSYTIAYTNNYTLSYIFIVQEVKKPNKWNNPKTNKTSNKVKSDSTASSEGADCVSEVKVTEVSESLEAVSMTTEDSEKQSS